MPRTVEPVIPEQTMSSMSQPAIAIDESLQLRPFGAADAPAVHRAFDDPDIRHWHGFRTDVIDEARKWIERANELWTLDKSGVWAIADEADDVLGRVALHVDLHDGTAEIAYWVLPEARRQAVAARSVRAVTSWGHDVLGVHRILLQHSTHNAASCAVARRAGYVAEGTARQGDLHADGWHDMHQHAHLASD